MTSHLGALLDWTVADLMFLGIAVQQYISVSLDLKKTKAREAAAKAVLDGADKDRVQGGV